MGRGNLPVIVYFIIGFAVLGLITMLMKAPLNFITNIFLAIGVLFVIYFILTALLNRRRFGGNEEMQKYRRAVKQSKMKYNNSSQKVTRITQNRRPSPMKTKRRRRNVPHLTVIEGKKSTNNEDRASN